MFKICNKRQIIDNKDLQKWIEMLGNKDFLVLYAGHPATKCSAFKYCSEKYLNLLIDLYEQLSRQKGKWNSLCWVQGINPPSVARVYPCLNTGSHLRATCFVRVWEFRTKNKKIWKGLVALNIWNTHLSSVRQFISGQHNKLALKTQILLNSWVFSGT